jgi:hypothetical protein
MRRERWPGRARGGEIGDLRVLFTCRPLVGHYEPLLAFAGAVARAGHPVAFATGHPTAQRARASGFAAFDAGPVESLPGAVAHRMPSPVRLATDAGRSFFFTWVFVGLELERRATDLEAVVATWQPDVVSMSSPNSPRRSWRLPRDCRRPRATTGRSRRGRSWRAAGAMAAPHWQRRGLPADAYAGAFRHLYLDVCPPRLQLPWCTSFAPSNGCARRARSSPTARLNLRRGSTAFPGAAPCM